tara:strand:+ start:516 stop:707 length:192 start_codon:yes stop_codon:yes gene_type:complete
MSCINPDANLVYYLNSLTQSERNLEFLRAQEIIKQLEINYEKQQEEKKKVNCSSIFSLLLGDY